jgi:hypothetical protein
MAKVSPNKIPPLERISSVLIGVVEVSAEFYIQVYWNLQ